MDLLDADFELRPLVNLWHSTNQFPMWFMHGRDEYGNATFDIADHKEPEPGTIYTLGDRVFEFIEIIEKRKSRGVYIHCETPNWYKIRCGEITGRIKTRFAGDENKGKVLIHIDYEGLEDAA